MELTKHTAPCVITDDHAIDVNLLCKFLASGSQQSSRQRNGRTYNGKFVLLYNGKILCQTFLAVAIMAKFYAKVVLLLPKGSFYAEMFCINFPCVSYVQQSECTAYKGKFLCQLL